MSPLVYLERDREKLTAYAEDLLQDHDKHAEEVREIWKCHLGAIQARQDRLVDAYLEGTLDKESFESRKRTLLLEKLGLEGKLAQDADKAKIQDRLSKIFELAFSALLSHEVATDEEKREHLEILTSNRAVNDKSVVVELSYPFCLLAVDGDVLSGAPVRNSSRTNRSLPPNTRGTSSRALRHIVKEIYDWIIKQSPALE